VSSQTIPSLTPEQYLEIERKADYKSEYIDGGMFAMAGASPNHSRIVTNSILQLGPQLRGGPCEVFSTDLRLFIEAVRVYTYPDIMVMCDTAGHGSDEQANGGERDTVVNPRSIAEVLSDSTKTTTGVRSSDFTGRSPAFPITF
jgi:Uma2 family endonuclease